MKVAIIPARGGSKRIPRKNIRDFCGKPMLVHSIDVALKCNIFDRVIVSTDDAEIAHIAGQHGAEVPFQRPAELSDDHATTTEVVAHAVNCLAKKGPAPTAVCCIFATAPFIRIDDLVQAFKLLNDGPWQYVFAATKYSYPIFRSFKKGDSGGLEMFFPEHYTSRSQDLPEALHDAGQFYWGRPEAWTGNLPIFGPHSTIVMIPSWRVQDIDSPDDWIRAEYISSLMEKVEKNAHLL